MMDEKVRKLIEYIKTNFPDGCGHSTCPDTCPVLIHGVHSLEGDVCDLLANMEDRTR